MKVAIIKNDMLDYNRIAPFNPSTNYPEYPFKDVSRKNMTYDSVRKIFFMLGMDKKNYDKKSWNPFGEIIKPSNIVLINVDGIEVVLAPLDTDIEASTKVSTFPIPVDMTIVSAFINVDTAPTGSSAIWDINLNGPTVLSTKITIEAGETSSLDAASQPVFSTSNADKGDQLSIDCDQIGATVAGQNPVLVLIFKSR